MSKILSLLSGGLGMKIGIVALLAAIPCAFFTGYDYGQSKEMLKNVKVENKQIKAYKEERDGALEKARVSAMKAEKVKIETKIVFKHIKHEVIRYVQADPDSNVDFISDDELQFIRGIVDATKGLSNPGKPVSADRVAVRLPGGQEERHSFQNDGAVGLGVQAMSGREEFSDRSSERTAEIIQELT